MREREEEFEDKSENSSTYCCDADFPLFSEFS